MAVRLYAIVRFAPRTRARTLPEGLSGERLRLLTTTSGTIVFAEAGPAAPDLETLLAYARVIDAIAAKVVAILPARFGTIATGATALKAEIEARRAELRRGLTQVAGRVQMKVTIESEAPPTRKTSAGRSASRRARAGAAYLRAKAAAQSPPELLLVRRLVGKLAAAEQVEFVASRLVIYHLIDRRRERLYRAALQSLLVTGPFAPYAFVPAGVFNRNDRKLR